MNLLSTVFCSLLLLAEIFCIKMIPVLTATFPLENTDAVMFTLSQNVDGSRDFAISLVLDAVKNSLILTLFIVGLTIALSIFFAYCRKKNVLKISSRWSFRKLLVALNVVSIIVLAKCVYSDIPVIDYYVKWKDSLVAPGHSDFYIKEYVNPDSVHIEFEEKRNLILIFLESMEYNFQDSANGGNLAENLIPEITEFMKNEQSFIPGGTQITGTGWTMADAVAKTCGIPMVLSSSMINDAKLMEVFFPGVTCLTDILIGNDYNVVVSKGANMKFSGMDVFLNSHSNPSAFGFAEYLKDKSRIKGDVISEWGVKDSMHYELAKEHIGRLAKQDKPWALWFFTVNTHTPHGILDSTCGVSQNLVGTERMQAVIRCSSRQLDGFIKWAKTQEWFDNTVIAVMGDHATMAAPELVGFKDENIMHYWLDFFINSSQQIEKTKRFFSSLDMFPTILEAMGANIPKRSLGLGRSLYSTEPTLLEKYGLDSLNKVLSKHSVEYDYFLFYRRK